MLYFACHAEPVRLTEHLRDTRMSEQKKEKELSEASAIAGHVANSLSIILCKCSLMQVFLCLLEPFCPFCSLDTVVLSVEPLHCFRC